jgi:hypothetical protein
MLTEYLIQKSYDEVLAFILQQYDDKSHLLLTCDAEYTAGTRADG